MQVEFKIYIELKNAILNKMLNAMFDLGFKKFLNPLRIELIFVKF